MTTALEHVILGYAGGGQNNRRLDLLACSRDAPSQDPAHYRRRIELEPMPVSHAQASQSLAMLAYDETRAMLARAHFQDSQQTLPAYQYILVPYGAWSELGARLDPLLSLVTDPIPREQSNHAAALKLPPMNAKRLDRRRAQLRRLIERMPAGRFDFAMTLLGAAVDERRLLVRNFPLDFRRRIELIQGIQALLPAAAAMRMTFSSHSVPSSAADPRIAFADGGDETWVYDWRQPHIIAAVLEHPYIQLLRSLWKGDVQAFAAAIEGLDWLDLNFAADSDWAGHLILLTERFSLDMQVAAGDAVETGAMIDALAGDAPPRGRLRVQYIERLLANALDNRDAVAGLRVAEELERDAELEPALAGLFDDMLETQPDTVYVFIRNRLNHLGMDKEWIPRLQLAAANSLEVAIQDSDTPTLVSWLELIAREPQAYQLLDVLRQGILSAQARAAADGELGIHLILIAARRMPELADVLRQDDRLIHAVAVNASQALPAASNQSLKALTDEAPEYFLLALFHGIQASDGALVTAAAVKNLWKLYQSEAAFNLPPGCQPAALIRLLAAQASHQMTEHATDRLLQRIIAASDADLLIETAHHLAGRNMLFPRLGTVLEADSFALDTILSVMNAVTGIDGVSSQEIIDTYFTLLDYYEWAPETQPMIEALVRLMGSQPALSASYRHLWKLCETCNALQIETAARAAINQLLRQFAEEDDTAAVVAGIARIDRQIHWSRTLPAALNGWWRGYARTRTLMQLQRIEREMDAQRHLETQKQILKTVLAMRRLMHDRDPVEFAAALNTACALIENIADAFDAARLTEIDPPAIRRELEAVSAELSTDERHVLANNLRDLAYRITFMANNRSKPSLMRSDDSIDRHLMLGEANPHGSIDMMKWIAGYLGGTHRGADD